MNETLKQLTSQRIRLDVIKSKMAKLPRSRGQALAYTALEKGRMYVGEICRELGKEYPYEATKKATTAEGIQDAVDVSDNKVTIDENEIVACNELRDVLDTELGIFLGTVHDPNNAINLSTLVDVFTMAAAIAESYKGLKEARMWLGIRLGEIRDNAKN